MSAGRVVPGALVQDPETGYWHEQKPAAPQNCLGTPVPRLPEDQASYILGCYVPGSCPREFKADGQSLDAGQFAIHCRDLFGWGDDVLPATYYRRINQVLLDADLPVRSPFSKGSYRRDPNGEATVPKSLLEW